MPKKHELNVFDDAGGEHLATVVIFGHSDGEIDDKLEQLIAQCVREWRLEQLCLVYRFVHVFEQQPVFDLGF